MIEIEGLYFNLNGFKLVIDHLKILKNEKVAILGENGSGKSTFLNILSGFYKTNKKIKIGENFIEEISPQNKAKLIAYLPQFSEILFNFTVFETVLMGRYPYIKNFGFTEEDYKLTEDVLIEFDLVDYKDKIYSKLSGGEKKRVMIARTVNQDSEILLFDEPFAMLDAKYTTQLLEILKNLRKTLICVLHDINIARSIFDRLIFFKHGKILYDIPKENLNEKILEDVFDVKFQSFDNFYFFKF